MDLYDFFLGEFSYIPLMLCLIVILIVLGKFIGKYPPPLPRSENPKRILLEISIYFLFTLVYLAFSIFFLSPILNSLFGDSYYIGVIISTIILFILLIYLRYHDHWTGRDLGINSTVKSWPIAIGSVIFYVLFGIYNLFRLEPMEVYWYFLILLFYSNAFLEEITFRGMIQTKFEQALGQKKALIYQAILFMLIHIPANIMRLLMDGNLARFYWNFAFQLVHGLVFGLIFMKTRNIWPSVICHFLNNWMGTLIMLFL